MCVSVYARVYALIKGVCGFYYMFYLYKQKRDTYSFENFTSGFLIFNTLCKNE